MSPVEERKSKPDPGNAPPEEWSEDLTEDEEELIMQTIFDEREKSR